MLVEVRANALVDDLTVQVKQYLPGGETRVYPLHEAVVDPDEDGYIVLVDGDPIRLRVQLPGSGAFAVHITANPLDSDVDMLVSTFCREIEGVVERLQGI